jgi:chemosensory pili system protein ChpA (sensor histidine kinase/response regulator)
MPNLILLDLEMPRMNGLELTSHIRANEETKDVPVIVVTSRSTDKHRQQAARVGASAYVTKPFQENELLDLIHASLKDSERRDAVG